MKKAATRWQPLFGLGSVECQRDVSLQIILTLIYSATKVVGAAGLEPARPKSRDFKSPASANSATPPDMFSYYATTFYLVDAKLASKLQATAFFDRQQRQLSPGQKASHSHLLPGV